ncbi:hypothetical protein AVEN_188900-1 [Araneus ventricosus]|uniref:Uncharacterized protein n=1 Tax=Araneus ventricosus TaxID=182803 RepID=A0A4Y2P746_ARAVE|nr:hypothetical protein AVEN_188900-1 [Araneus ventricosus]
MFVFTGVRRRKGYANRKRMDVHVYWCRRKGPANREERWFMHVYMFTGVGGGYANRRMVHAFCTIVGEEDLLTEDRLMHVYMFICSGEEDMLSEGMVHACLHVTGVGGQDLLTEEHGSCCLHVTLLGEEVANKRK